MKVQVSGKHIAVGEALRTRVTDEISQAVGKFFERGGSADVVVSREGHAYKVICSVVLASGQHLESQGLGDDAHLAFSRALAKIEGRIRRYKHRLKSHTAAASARQAETAAYYVLQAPDDTDNDLWEAEGLEPADHALPAALVIAETEKALKTMTVAMAVMELDLTESQTIVFRNAAHGGLSVIYRRPDGNIGWIDPARTLSPKGS